MPFATLDDVNMHLPTDKLEMKQPTLDLVGVDAERIIRGYLANVYSPATLAGWSDPSVTNPVSPGYVPRLIKSIAGRFIAAFWYRNRLSEDSLDDPQYAQVKYNEAIALIDQIIEGDITLDDVIEVPNTTEGYSAEDFYPNSADVDPSFFSVNDNLFRTGIGIRVSQ
jgi:hypothetical protein